MHCCGLFYFGEWLLTDKVLMTSVSDKNVAISMYSFLGNFLCQSLNAYLMSCIFISNHLFVYIGGSIIIYRMRTISNILRDPIVVNQTGEISQAERRSILIECHEMHLEVMR